MMMAAVKGQAVQGLSYGYKVDGIWLTAAFEIHTVIGEGRITGMFAGIDRKAIGPVTLYLEDGNTALSFPETLMGMWA